MASNALECLGLIAALAAPDYWTPPPIVEQAKTYMVKPELLIEYKRNDAERQFKILCDKRNAEGQLVACDYEDVKEPCRGE